MNHKDYNTVRYFIENKSFNLLKHENKNFAKVAFPIQNFSLQQIEGRTFYLVETNVFKEIMQGVLIEALNMYPEKFGTGNALNVIEAIHLIEPIFDFENFVEFLRTEQFCFVIECDNGTIKDEVLRIDLYRHLSKKKDAFIGGIFHALKHFSYIGKNLSIGKDINDITSIDQIIGIAIKGFFFSKKEAVNKKKFISRVHLNDSYDLKFAFHFEEKPGVFFIDTIFKKTK